MRKNVQTLRVTKRNEDLILFYFFSILPATQKIGTIDNKPSMPDNY